MPMFGDIRIMARTTQSSVVLLLWQKVHFHVAIHKAYLFYRKSGASEKQQQFCMSLSGFIKRKVFKFDFYTISFLQFKLDSYCEL